VHALVLQVSKNRSNYFYASGNQQQSGFNPSLKFLASPIPKIRFQSHNLKMSQVTLTMQIRGSLSSQN